MATSRTQSSARTTRAIHQRAELNDLGVNPAAAKRPAGVHQINELPSNTDHALKKFFADGTVRKALRASLSRGKK
jgi:hypothetical protein